MCLQQTMVCLQSPCVSYSQLLDVSVELGNKHVKAVCGGGMVMM